MEVAAAEGVGRSPEEEGAGDGEAEGADENGEGEEDAGEEFGTFLTAQDRRVASVLKELGL